MKCRLVFGSLNYAGLIFRKTRDLTIILNPAKPGFNPYVAIADLFIANQ